MVGQRIQKNFLEATAKTVETKSARFFFLAAFKSTRWNGWPKKKNIRSVNGKTNLSRTNKTNGLRCTTDAETKDEFNEWRKTERSFNLCSYIKPHVSATDEIFIIHVKAAVGVRFFDAKVFVKFVIFSLHSFCAHYDFRWKEH